MALGWLPFLDFAGSPTGAVGYLRAKVRIVPTLSATIEIQPTLVGTPSLEPALEMAYAND